MYFFSSTIFTEREGAHTHTHTQTERPIHRQRDRGSQKNRQIETAIHDTDRKIHRQRDRQMSPERRGNYVFTKIGIYHFQIL